MTIDSAGLQRALAVILPDARDTLLLRACLRGDAVAWDRWCAGGEPKAVLEADNRGLKGLLPLIGNAVRTFGLPAPPALVTYLKAASLREDLRSELIHRILAEVLDGLSAAAVPHVLMGGLVEANAAYARPGLRHCHSIDFLVDAAARADAHRALGARGFGRIEGAAWRWGDGIAAYRHADGLALNLHQDVTDHPHYQRAVWRLDPAGLMIAGRSVGVPSAPDRLVAILARAATRRDRSNLRWACDAVHLLGAAPDAFDWAPFAAISCNRGLALPFVVMCRYLAATLGVVVPADVMNRLAEGAGRAEGADREAALDGAIIGLSTALGALRSGDGAARRDVARVLLWPSARCLAWRYGPASLPRRIVQRAAAPVRYAASRLATSAKRPSAAQKSGR